MTRVATALAALALVACQREERKAPEVPPAPPPPAPVDAAPRPNADAAPAPDPTVVVPPLGWATADTITIDDGWGGLGCSHRYQVTLRRQGAVFTGTATLNEDKRPVELPASAIAALEAATVRALQTRPAPPPDTNPNQASWTDDYPAGAMTFKSGRAVTRLYYENQRRVLHLERDGVKTPLDWPFRMVEQPARPMWDAYKRFLDHDLGVRAWIDTLCR